MIDHTSSSKPLGRVRGVNVWRRVLAQQVCGVHGSRGGFSVDAQALRVLRAAAAQKGLLQVTEPEGTVAAAPQRPRKTRTRDKAEL